jgi:multimeric flavodoxin WrbA
VKVVAFNGSPRRGGNIELLLSEVEKAVTATFNDLQEREVRQSANPADGVSAINDVHEVYEWKRFDLNSMNMRPCQDCGGCDKTGTCVIKDDMVQVHQAIRDADRIILASPVFFFGLSAQTKAMIDRCQAFWCEKYLLKRPLPGGPFGRKGLLLLVGGMKKEVGIQCSETTARAFFRTVSVPEHETLGFLGVDAKGAIAEHETAFGDVYHAAEKLVTTEKR